MILFAFVLFAVLIAGWLLAPVSKGKVAPSAATAPALQLNEAAA